MGCLLLLLFSVNSLFEGRLENVQTRTWFPSQQQLSRSSPCGGLGGDSVLEQKSGQLICDVIALLLLQTLFHHSHSPFSQSIGGWIDMVLLWPDEFHLDGRTHGTQTLQFVGRYQTLGCLEYRTEQTIFSAQGLIQGGWMGWLATPLWSHKDTET